MVTRLIGHFVEATSASYYPIVRGLYPLIALHDCNRQSVIVQLFSILAFPRDLLFSKESLPNFGSQLIPKRLNHIHSTTINARATVYCCLIHSAS